MPARSKHFVPSLIYWCHKNCLWSHLFGFAVFAFGVLTGAHFPRSFKFCFLNVFKQAKYGKSNLLHIILNFFGMRARWRTARVFISSTFRDMHGERDLLTRFVFPELKARAEKLFVNVYEVDLRWGVTEADTQTHRWTDTDAESRTQIQILGYAGRQTHTKTQAGAHLNTWGR